MNIDEAVSLFGVVELHSYNAFMVKICVDIICSLNGFPIQTIKESVDFSLFLNYIRLLSFSASLRSSNQKKIYFNL